MIEESVSRETFEKIKLFCSFLEKWNKRFNLVGPKEIASLLERHVLDSIQIAKLLEPSKKILDIGSGGGFPGIILGILGFKDITLCEINKKKSIFLKEISFKLNLNCTILNKDVFSINQKFDCVVSRAFSCLDNLLFVMEKVSRETTEGFFFKSEKYPIEILEAQKRWLFQHRVIESLTKNGSVIINIRNLSKKKCPKL